MRRSWVAAGLLAAVLAGLLVAWFYAGWADVRARQREVQAAPQQAAARRATTLAYELRGELAKLMSREVERPYFHYQNLMHDPRSSSGVSVTPSPLAGPPVEPLVRGYFQVDAKGRASTPTLNDDVPDLNEPSALAGNLRFRDEVTRSLARVLTPPAQPMVEKLVAAAELAPPKQSKVKRPKVITLDRDSYTQNNLSNAIYQDNKPGIERAVETRAYTRQARVQPVSEPVTIVVSPLEWRTQTFEGVPTLLAVRHVSTPDGNLSQGFVVDRATLTSWLAERAGDAVLELATGDDESAELAPGWHLAAQANPRVIASAAADSARLARMFIVRFLVIGLVAALAAGLVVLLVARAERLARERSQFAAAAAHELRTPLAGLQLYGDMLADGLGDPTKQRDYARRMSEEASRLGRVVSNVLGFSQLERGNLSVEPTNARLDEALRRLAERAEPALDRAGATLALEVTPALSARFDGDALARIVGNLLDNAEKYSRDAEDRTITLAAREVDGSVEVAVSDHGPGIAATTRARLFRPFARGVTADGPAGLGLGLALSRSLAHAMGGELEHRPSEAGATFVLRLPAAAT